MKRAKTICAAFVAAICVLLTGCVSLEARTNDNAAVQPLLRTQGVINSSLSFGFCPYEGKAIDVGLLCDDKQWGNLVSLDVWPIAGFGIGFTGFRLKILPLEFGFGFTPAYSHSKCYPVEQVINVGPEDGD